MSLRSTVKKVIPSGLFPAIEPYGHLAEAVLINTLNGYPGRGLKVIGVTGTNGKTTTSFLIHRMLQDAGLKVGLMTTVAWGIGNDIRPQVHHMTTVAVPEMMQRLKQMQAANVDWVVLETTSQALAQHRVWGIPYSVVVFTNLTHEHLSYHRTFERYRDAKRLMFKMANKNHRGMKTGIINSDDPNAKYFERDISHVLSYGIKSGQAKAEDIVLSPNGVRYSVTIRSTEYNISCQIPGSFNVENSLAAVCVGVTLGLSKMQIEQGIAALPGVEGRMTKIDEGQPFSVIVDYAHSPDSFEKLFIDIRPVVTGKLIVLFGSLGGGDTAKRPQQGALAGKFADEVVICEEDDRQEDGTKIMEDIAAGARSAGKQLDTDLFIIHDRPEAIAFALGRAQKGDCVLLLGKGHEKTIEHADGEHPWDEIGTARSALQDRISQK